MKVKVDVKRTEPKKLKYRNKRKKKRTVKGRASRALGNVLEALFLIIGFAGFLYISFFM